MKAININGKIESYGQIPKTWNKVQNYQKADPSIHYSDGWRDVIVPSYNTATQKLGGLIQDGDDVTYQVINLTDEEIKQRVASNAQIQKEQFTRVKLEKQIETELQVLTDDIEILENQQGYPLWSDFPEGYSFSLNEKVQGFEGTDLKIYKVIQVHNKQSDWEPINVPALFVKVLPPGAALIWEAGLQVTIGQEYEYQGKTYIVVQSHTTQIGWEPTNVPALWNEKT